MGTYTVYRLRFKTQLHLGRTAGHMQHGTLGLEQTAIYIPADTLFSAICQTWATFYDSDSFTEFLKPYTEDNPVLPFTLTSAFPFAQDIYLFPKPLTYVNRSRGSKRIQFVSHTVFEQIIAGTPPALDIDLLINNKKVWGSPQEKVMLETALGTEPAIWRTETRPRVTTGGHNTDSEIWYIQTVQFNKHCGLWFAVQCDSEDTQQKIETLLRIRGDTGIGGERTPGYGMFDFSTDGTITLPEAGPGDNFVTLAPICPKSPEQLDVILTGDVAYALTPVVGWTSSTTTDLRRKHILMFTEGSVLHSSGQRIGRLVDLRAATESHPIYRYGYAWQVGVEGVTE